jgi:hypothetical protein
LAPGRGRDHTIAADKAFSEFSLGDGKESRLLGKNPFILNIGRLYLQDENPRRFVDESGGFGLQAGGNTGA